MKKIKLFALLSLVMVTTIMFSACGKSSKDFPCPSGCQHEDIYRGLDFQIDRVVVTIHENYYSRNFNVADFKVVNAKEIVVDMPAFNPSDRQILTIILSDTGRQNVICAVQLIKALEFVYEAEPAYNFTAENDAH